MSIEEGILAEEKHMYETPELKRFGSFRELTQTGGYCSFFESSYPGLFEWMTGKGYCVDDTPDGGGGMS